MLIPPRERAEIAFVADNPGDWMIHCHVLEHQEGGMTGGGMMGMGSAEVPNLKKLEPADRVAAIRYCRDGTVNLRVSGERRDGTA